MNNFFKKTVVATAVLGFCGAAQAAQIELTQAAPTFPAVVVPVKVANEYVSAADSVYLHGYNLVFKAEANFTDTDVLAFTFKGVAPVLANFQASELRNAGNDLVADLDLLSVSTNNDGDTVVVYRVTNVNSVLGTNGAISGNLLSNRVFAGVNAARAPITVSFEGKTVTGFAVDSKIEDQTLITFAAALPDNLTVSSAFGSVSGTDRRIDVSADPSRTVFITGTNTGTRSRIDSAAFGITQVAQDLAPTVNTVEYTIHGDLAFAVDVSGVAPVLRDVAGTPALEVERADNTACSFVPAQSSVEQATFSCAFTDAVTATFTVPGTGAIDVNKFEVSAAAKYSRAIAASGTTSEDATASYAETDAGIWRLNGSSVNIPYLPLSGTLEPVVIVSNNTGLAAGLQIDVRVGGESFTNLVLTGTDGQPLVAAANSSMNVGDAIERAVRTATGNPSATGLLRTNVTLVTNAPQDKVGVYSAYRNRTGDVRDLRIVVNTSNGASNGPS